MNLIIENENVFVALQNSNFLKQMRSYSCFTKIIIPET